MLFFSAALAHLIRYEPSWTGGEAWEVFSLLTKVYQECRGQVEVVVPVRLGLSTYTARPSMRAGGGLWRAWEQLMVWSEAQV